jgi:hypothetical protein
MLAVRKDDDSPKGDSRRVNGALPNTPCRYAFIDDLVSSGETLRRVHGSIGYAFPQAELAGLIMYRSHYPADLRCDLARVIGPERAERALVKVFDDWSNDDSTD